MKIRIYQVDAFTDKVFQGNPAAVCPLTEWLDEKILLKIAAENNLSETAFYVPTNDGFEIRWFTPSTEVDLCGHATLATAYVLYHQENYKREEIEFYSPRSGRLTARIKENKFILNFPVDDIQEVSIGETLVSLTNKKPIAAFKGNSDYMLVFEDEEDIQTMVPNLKIIAQQNIRGLIVTAAGKNHDFVSRFFGPGVGVDEDPVCGSAHTTLTPFWATQLDKKKLNAYQLSKRGGEVFCQLLDGRVELGGQAVLYLKGEIEI
ncbi:PhzF family phenazine biosynthesis protein [Pedobacter cryoconitis]|uniref:PhzF family phenazine biosynthesis protein n=1 Tax=Pedobacter cryoconitis TaxID=188932 RepID=A0A7W8ZQK8_9SPHI|nr:PhzF family phenazine biosynthesis protein [Pedobacter cryoconitis]MBB5638351.1 PhzF family phenazine biosynthesis protein [Pedobacter cryoconitis]